MTKLQSSNWAQSAKWECEGVLRPTSLQELQKIVKEANTKGQKLKAIGAGHSFSSCMETTGFNVDMRGINRVLGFDLKNQTVTAEAGIYLEDLYAEMEKNKLALAALPNIDRITLGGAVVNSTHGSTYKIGTFSDQVVELTMVIATGELIKLRRRVPSYFATENQKAYIESIKDQVSDEESDMFEAAIASFGSIGMIYSITMNCVPAFNTLVHLEVHPLSHITGHMKEYIQAYDCCQFIVQTAYDSVLCKTQTFVSPSLTTPVQTRNDFMIITSRILLWALKGSWSGGFVRTFLAKFIAILLTFSLSRQIFTWCLKSLSIKKWNTGELLDFKQTFVNMEYNVPAERIDEAVVAIMDLEKKYAKSGKYSRILPIVVRPVGRDTLGFLSLTKGRDSICIDLPYQVMDEYEFKFYKEVEDVLLGMDGRVSWSRLFWADPKKIAQGYPEMKKFYEVKQKLDPNGVFSSAFTDRVFGSVMN